MKHLEQDIMDLNLMLSYLNSKQSSNSSMKMS